MSTLQIAELTAAERVSGSAWTERYADAVMNTFGLPQRVLVRGEGCWVWDADGNRYLDLLAGLAVNCLGHAHPLLVSAVTSQLTTLGHVSNFFASAPQVVLAERLLDLLGVAGDGKVFFTNSGTEANEAAVKLTRRTGRTKLIAAVDAFHGRSMGALAVTWKPAYREPFQPLPGDVEFVAYGDTNALAQAIDDSTAAVILEPIQGEAGVNPAPDDYLRAARELTERRGALLILDEVQTGMGRTGDWFAFQRHGITPDVVTLAKGLGGGIPVGACVGIGRAAALLSPGQHGTTFGGNPVAAAAALAVIYAIQRDDLLLNVRTIGTRLRTGVEALGHPLIDVVRGEGLLLGIGLSEEIAPLAAQVAMQQGFIVNAVRPDTIRLAPPYILTPEQADLFISALPGILDQAQKEA